MQGRIDEQVFLTKQGLDDLKKELDNLARVKQPDLIKRVATARDFGDLTENTEYANAREELAFVEGRIAELEEIVGKAKIIEENGKKGAKTVSLGSKVTVGLNGNKHIFHVVGEWEADPINKKISHSSPLGKALIGKKVKDKVEVEAPAGKILYTIIEID